MRERKALLLRVGIDRGTGGVLSPIFADGSFEYVPIPEAEPSRCSKSFASLPARHGETLAAFVPPRVASLPAHIDPDFNALAYGDAAPHKRRQLLRLEPGDLLVFYVGFVPRPQQDIPRLFVLGWFEVEVANSLTADRIRGDENLSARFGKTAHFLRDPPDPELALVEGRRERSRLLDRALPLGDGADRLLRDLAGFGYSGSLRRAVGHWFEGAAAAALEDWLRNGPAGLVGDGTRLFAVAATKIRPATSYRGDLVIADRRLAVGDWVYADEGDAFLLARFNGDTAPAERRASLFWDLRQARSTELRRAPIPDRQSLPEPGGAVVRRLVSWMASHYRIGVHSG